jgi:hypothetical protein
VSKRAQGDALEKKVCDLLDECDIKYVKNSGSGSVKGNGDISTKEYTFECKSNKLEKNKQVSSPKINIEDYKKAKFQSITYGKVPILVIENGLDDQFAVMSLYDLIQLLSKAEQNG